MRALAGPGPPLPADPALPLCHLSRWARRVKGLNHPLCAMAQWHKTLSPTHDRTHFHGPASHVGGAPSARGRLVCPLWDPHPAVGPPEQPHTLNKPATGERPFLPRHARGVWERFPPRWPMVACGLPLEWHQATTEQVAEAGLNHASPCAAVCASGAFFAAHGTYPLLENALRPPVQTALLWCQT